MTTPGRWARKRAGWGRHGLRHRHVSGHARSIAELKPHEEGIIASVQGDIKTAQRLADLGLTPEAVVLVANVAPLNGPIEIVVRGTKLAIGREIAEKILVREK